MTSCTLDENKYAEGIHVIVRDNGPGVAKEHINALFSRFYRVPGSNEIYQEIVSYHQ